MSEICRKGAQRSSLAQGRCGTLSSTRAQKRVAALYEQFHRFLSMDTGARFVNQNLNPVDGLAQNSADNVPCHIG